MCLNGLRTCYHNLINTLDLNITYQCQDTEHGSNNTPGTHCKMNNYVMDRVSVDTSTSGTTYYSTNEISHVPMHTSDNTFLLGRESWAQVVLMDIGAIEAMGHKYELAADGLKINEDFVWYYKKAEYDGFTMNQPRQAVFAFRDAAVASFYRLKWL